MDQVHVIRHKVLVEGLSIRQVARQMEVSRNTVRRYVAEETVPGIRTPVARGRPVYDRVCHKLQEMLEDSPRWTGGKQRLTAARLHQMLLEDGHEVGYTLVKSYVREWRRHRREVFVPLEYHKGELAEVDFFEVLIDVFGQRRKAWMFVMRLMYSGRDFAWVYDRQDQVSFLDGHVRAFEHFGAVPHRIIYDNLKAAVRKILVGSERELSARFEALSTHYLFEPCFARPREGHDKGGVEARGKAIRWQHLVPIPDGDGPETISEALLHRLDEQARHKRNAKGQTAMERFEVERGSMLPRREPAYRPAKPLHVKASRRSLVKVEGSHYSVWSRWAGLELMAYIGPYMVTVIGPDGEVVHERQRFGKRAVDYRHYIRELARKPQALRQVAPELIAALKHPFPMVWRQLVDRHGPKQAARVFAQVLKAIEELGQKEVERRLERALVTDEPIPLALLPEPPAEPTLSGSALPACLKGIEVVAASAADFDDLLGGEQ